MPFGPMTCWITTCSRARDSSLPFLDADAASVCGSAAAVPVWCDRCRCGERALTGCDTRRVVYGTERRAILTHSPEYHDSQAAGFDGTTLAKAAQKLGELAATLERGKTRRSRDKVEAEFSFRQIKDPRVVSFSPMFHWTEHNIRVHVFTCVLALQLAHLMRRQAAQAGPDLPVRELLSQLAGIGETVLIYPSTGGRPRARRMTTELTSDQQKLYQIFGLDRWAPRS